MTSRPPHSPADALNRRTFTAMCGAGALAPANVFAQTGGAANPDVVVVGAGAAGIAAAHALRDAGVSYVQVEAADRVGGRAFTETSTFGVPYDHGAHWVQSQHRNPYFARAKASDGRFYKAPEKYSFYTDDGKGSDADEAHFWEAVDAVATAIGNAGKRKQDVSPASVSPRDIPWADNAWFYLGPWIMGKEMDDFSCTDWWNSAGTVDWYYADGYGKLVADHAAQLQVSLNTSVTAIKWGGSGVAVETPEGTISAKAVIITVSTTVLAEEGITFDPPLPVEKQESFNAIPMGYYNHIGLRFSEDIFGMGADGYFFHKLDQSLEGFGALTNASGSGLAYCDVGGDFARELELAGKDAAIDFVKSTLRKHLGADVDKYFMGAAASDWGNNPLIKGCYASAAPGSFAMREVLRAPVGDRVFFAGEACHADMWATVGGADLSGRDTGAEVAALVS